MHVFTGETQPLERLGRGRLERLQREVRGIHRKVGMSVYEAGAHRPLREIDHPCAGRQTHGPLDPCNPVALDKDLGRARKGIGDTVEHIAAHQNVLHSSQRLLAPSANSSTSIAINARGAVAHSRSARRHARYEFTVFPPDLIGDCVLRCRLSPSSLTTRGWVCPVQSGNRDTNIEWVSVFFVLINVEGPGVGNV